MMDVWDLWHRAAALIFIDGQPVLDHAASVYILPSSDMSDDDVVKAIKGSLGRNIRAVSIQRDYFILCGGACSGKRENLWT